MQIAVTNTVDTLEDADDDETGFRLGVIITLQSNTFPTNIFYDLTFSRIQSRNLEILKL